MIIFVRIVITSLLLLAFKPDKNVLIWEEGKPLTWDDFNGKPEKRFAAASTHYDIFKKVTETEKSASVKIYAVFFRNASWKKKSWINDEVLAHEQKHFDIVELYARKLRKIIQETKFKNYQDLTAKIQVLYDKNDKEMDVYQDLYDEETDGSMNGEQQRAWQKKITAEIEALNKYKENTFLITFP